MTSLEILSLYLPYNLEVESYISDKRHILDAIEVDGKCRVKVCQVVDNDLVNYYDQHYRLKDIKPYVYPLSMLTEEIEYEKDRFVPIQKLFEISTGINYFDDEANYSFDYREVNNGSYLAYELNRGIALQYDSIIQTFRAFNDDQTQSEVKNQLKLFQKLFKWHFDVFNLIEQGKAIDKSKL